MDMMNPVSTPKEHGYILDIETGERYATFYENGTTKFAQAYLQEFYSSQGIPVPSSYLMQSEYSFLKERGWKRVYADVDQLPFQQLFLILDYRKMNQERYQFICSSDSPLAAAASTASS